MKNLGLGNEFRMFLCHLKKAEKMWTFFPFYSKLMFTFAEYIILLFLFILKITIFFIICIWIRFFVLFFFFSINFTQYSSPLSALMSFSGIFILSTLDHLDLSSVPLIWLTNCLFLWAVTISQACLALSVSHTWLKLQYPVCCSLSVLHLKKIIHQLSLLSESNL